MRTRFLSVTFAAFLAFTFAAPQHDAYASPPQQVQRTEPTKLSELTLEKRADVSYMSSPTTWATENWGFNVVDRYNIGKVTTRENLQRQPNDPKGWHGGNITGMTEKLDFEKGAGRTTLWATPVLGNYGEADHYHGYGIYDFLDTEKHFGTMDDYVTYVREAHKRGMRVVMDIVINHSGRAIEYEGPGFYDNGNKQPVKPGSRKQLVPAELMNHLQEEGEATDLGNHDQAMRADFWDGRFSKFDLSKKEAQDAFIKVYKHLIARTDVDGFRADTVKHVYPQFWARFNREIKEYAHSLGKKNFCTIAEHYAASPQEMAKLIQLKEGDYRSIDPNGDNQGFTMVLNFPSHFSEMEPLRGKAPTSQIKYSHEELARALTPDQLKRVGRFIDNHDNPRFLGENEGTLGNLKVAMARSQFGIGVPISYYLTNQGGRQMGGPFDYKNPGLFGRPDAFDSKFKSPGMKGSSFNTNHPLYRLDRQFADVRATYSALTEGQEFERWSDPNGAGLYVFSRIHNGKEVIVVVNTSKDARSADNIWIDRGAWEKNVWQAGKAPGKATLIDTLHPDYTTHVGAVANGGNYQGAQIGKVEVPGYGVRVLVSETDYKPTPLRNFHDDGVEKPWQPSTLKAAARMTGAPSMDHAQTGGNVRRPFVQTPAQAERTVRRAAAAAKRAQQVQAAKHP